MMGQAPMVPVNSVGGGAAFPQNYPLAYGTPAPAALLRPLQQPLFDTEIMTAAAPPALIQFFQRQQGQADASLTLTKAASETNLTQPGSLPTPLEFSLFGFNFCVQPYRGNEFVTLIDFSQIYTDGVWTFLYSGQRQYLQIPVHRIPHGVAPEGFSSSPAAERTVVHNGVGHISNFLKFTIGRAALRMRPMEAFQVNLSYPQGAPGIAAGQIRVQALLLGLSWNAL